MSVVKADSSSVDSSIKAISNLINKFPKQKSRNEKRNSFSNANTQLSTKKMKESKTIDLTCPNFEKEYINESSISNKLSNMTQILSERNNNNRCYHCEKSKIFA